MLAALRPVLNDAPAAEQIMKRCWRDHIALVWSAADIHRAANALDLALTQAQARDILAGLLKHHNPEYGLQRRDVRECIQQSGWGRPLTPGERQWFREKDVLSIDRPRQPAPKKLRA